jgi:hypothetical protein
MPGVPAVLCSPGVGSALRGMRMWLVVRPPAGSRTDVSLLMVAMRSDAASLSWKSACTLRILAMRRSLSLGCSTPAATSWLSWKRQQQQQTAATTAERQRQQEAGHSVCCM